MTTEKPIWFIVDYLFSPSTITVYCSQKQRRACTVWMQRGWFSGSIGEGGEGVGDFIPCGVGALARETSTLARTTRQVRSRLLREERNKQGAMALRSADEWSASGGVLSTERLVPRTQSHLDSTQPALQLNY